MLRDAVILAAGKGTRIRASETDLPKPLQEVHGVSLLERTLRTLRGAGIERAHVIVGFLADQLRAAVERFDLDGLAVSFIDNPDYERSNGVSVVAARGHIEGGFVLSMSDHVYDVSVAECAVHADLELADLQLCVDRRITEVYDLPDATKVRTENDRIVDIGKELETYDCIDCGVFAVGPALLDALADVRAQRGDCSLSDGVRLLASRGRARVIDIGDAFWQDVDTPGALDRAERMLVR
jgi:1L-myo-inositol 1-phosphate cytidylyltransferase